MLIVLVVAAWHGMSEPTTSPRRGRNDGAAAIAVALVAASNMFVGLGRSSLFIDEAFSWNAASAGIDTLLQSVRADEVAPPTYYLGLHEWIYRIGSMSEAAMRIPSAVAAVLLAPVVVWLARMVTSRAMSFSAGLIVALSPLTLEYGQQVRAYIFAALFSTVAFAAALTAQRRAGSARQGWLAVGAIAASAALALHYTAILTLAPLLWWAFYRAGWRRRTAILFSAPTVIVGVALLPLIGYQGNQGHGKGIAAAASFTVAHVIRVLASPFDWRAETSTGWTLLGLLLIIGAGIAIGRRRLTLAPELAWLIVPAALTTPVVLIAATAAGANSMISRYSVVSAPVVIVALVCGAELIGRRASLAIVGVATVACLGNTVPSHSSDGYFPDMHSAFRAIARHWRPGDRIALAGYPSIGPNANYYAQRLLPSGTYPLAEGDTAGLQRAVRARSRIWILSSTVQSRVVLEGNVKAIRYRLLEERTLKARTPLQLVLVAPR